MLSLGLSLPMNRLLPTKAVESLDLIRVGSVALNSDHLNKICPFKHFDDSRRSISEPKLEAVLAETQHVANHAA